MVEKSKNKKTKFVFIIGGVMSGIGKGIVTASTGRILKDYGYKVSAMKIDQYFNVDAGTMNPVEHGEVFVTDDGLESDQDLGNYERFLDVDMHRENYMTSGMVYLSVINRERSLEYNGKTIEAIPHIPEEIIHRLVELANKSKAEIILVEIGGTVGEYQNLVYLEAARMMKLSMPENVAFVLVSYLPILEHIGEMKSKPTQYTVRTLNEAGIQPDIIVARAKVPLDEKRKEKIAIAANMRPEYVISAPNVKSVYEVPLNFTKDKIGVRLLKRLGLKTKGEGLSKEWQNLPKDIKKFHKPVKIGIVGKYFESGNFSLTDSYISVIEAVKHAAWALKLDPKITWLSSKKYEKDKRNLKELKKFDAVIIPGGFGKRGIEGKIRAVEYVRQNNIPFLGLCYGLQIAVIEYARDVLKLKDANSTEIDPGCANPIITTMQGQKEKIAHKDMGGTMRLGAYDCKLKKDSLAQKLYGKNIVSERHRHRYELNNKYVEMLYNNGMIISGINPQRNLAEIIELPDKKFFMATQFHPEFKSRPMKPHPLFKGLIKAATSCKS